MTLNGPELDTFLALKDRLVGQSETWILSTLAASALRSIQENNLAFSLPIKLRVEPSEPVKTVKK